MKPCIESKVFGIGVEAYTVGSAEFALSCAAFNKDKCIPLMDNGHYHPTEVVSDKIPALLAMTYVHDLDTRAFTRTLWQMCTECVVVFPDGVNVMPWMLCGTNEIGVATAEQMGTARLVVWSQHGISCHGKGAIQEIPGIIQTKGFKKAFIASDPGLVKFGITRKVTDLLDVTGMDQAVHDRLHCQRWAAGGLETSGNLPEVKAADGRRPIAPHR